MLVVLGPQGAGNHLWSKIFALHPQVYGWRSLLENYWEPHRFCEPFAEYWRDPGLLKTFDWNQSDYYVTGISVPLGIPGSEENPLYRLDIRRFLQQLMSLDIAVQIAVIGRDQNILHKQQTRIRSEPTLPMFLEELENLRPIASFLSYELLHLYRSSYLRSLDLIIPIAHDNPKINEILEQDANAKYIKYVEENPLDAGNHYGHIFKQKP